MDFRGKNIDLVGKMPLWFGISLTIMLIGLFGWLWPKPDIGLNLGIDFKGGSQFTYRIPPAVRPQAGQEVALLEKVNGGLQSAKLIGTRTQIAGGQDLIVNTSAATDSEANAQQRIVDEAVGQAFGVPNIKPEGQQRVGAVIGDELRANAIKGVLIGVILIAGWIYIRYNFAGDGLRYAVAGIVALVHDVIVLLGLFALIGKIDPRIEVDGAFIAALLTVVGYSINDSVVIFDRLRENLRLRRKEPFEKVVNDSLLETMSRSINTGLTVLIMLFVLLMFGGREHLQLRLGDAGGHRVGSVFLDFQRLDGARGVASLGRKEGGPSARQSRGPSADQGARNRARHGRDAVEVGIIRFFPHPNPLPEGEGTMRRRFRLVDFAATLKLIQARESGDAWFLLLRERVRVREKPGNFISHLAQARPKPAFSKKESKFYFSGRENP